MILFIQKSGTTDFVKKRGGGDYILFMMFSPAITKESLTNERKHQLNQNAL